jgi:CRISPR-associated protein (TIGR03986 family)
VNPHANKNFSRKENRAGQSLPEDEQLPYAFISIDPDVAVHDTPMPRDGRSTEARKSGEILVTLTALTPLIVGNHHLQADDGKSGEIVPERLPDEHRRVLIAGSSLKGLLRHTIASLLNSPMERVLNRHYTYRPNFAGSGDGKKICAAVVLEPFGETGGGLKVALLKNMGSVVFVRTKVWKALKEPAAGAVLVGKAYRGLKLDDNHFRQRLDIARTPDGRQDPDARAVFKEDHIFLRYVGGIDGEGLLTKAFEPRNDIYRYVLYPKAEYESAKGRSVTIPPEVVRHYQKTQKILANEAYGHLAPGHPLLVADKKLDKKAAIEAIQKQTELKPLQLIYVEFDTQAEKITSFGHHYQYRWAYTSSTQEKAGKARREIGWLPVECMDDEGKPEQLVAARLMFGYALDNKEKAEVAEGNWKRLAGRVSPNSAVEVIVLGREGEDRRFLDAGRPLRLNILGMPRPSAVEFYLKQTQLPRKLVTYGDLPGDPGGDLAGRKSYRHQPDASKEKCYASRQEDQNAQERGTVVHAVSVPGSQFRFTVRFDQLRAWELGALVAALAPAKLARRVGQADARYAHKLGYGKPLGLGSVELTLDKARYRENDTWEWQIVENLDAFCDEVLDALLEKLGEKGRKGLNAWLDAYRYPEHGRAAYPTALSRRGEQTIYDFHTSLRRAHATARRGGFVKPGEQQLLQRLQKLLGEPHG